MTTVAEISASLVGVLGVVLGIFVAEWIRRRNRIEAYSSKVFERRLKIYQELYNRIQAAQQIAEDVIENQTYTREQRHDLISSIVLPLATFCDENGFYLDEEITVHCVGMWMGVEAILHLPSLEKKERVTRLRHSVVDAKTMIRRASGMEEIEYVFRSMMKPLDPSALIEYYRELRKLKAEKQRGMGG